MSAKWEKHGKWKGGRTKDKDGYWMVRVRKDDPYYSMNVQNYVREHRYVMAQKIGRPLDRSEIVHHINGDRTDNRPENLELLVNAQQHRLIEAMQKRIHELEYELQQLKNPN